MQREVRDLEQRCQASEARHQDLAANIPEATRPLLRQLEAMQVPCPRTMCLVLIASALSDGAFG